MVDNVSSSAVFKVCFVNGEESCLQEFPETELEEKEIQFKMVVSTLLYSSSVQGCLPICCI
jgi:hypothetical protein